MEYTTIQVILFLIAGFSAGFINTLAGSGSTFTLASFVFAGIPTPIANGTNRMGITVQGILSVAMLYSKKRKYLFNKKWKYIIPILVGAIAGASLAVQVNKQTMDLIIITVFILIGVMHFGKKIKLKTFRSTKVEIKIKSVKLLLTIVALFALGFYGGFIQLGMGVVLLLFLTHILKINLVEANEIKLISIAIYSIVVLGIYLLSNKVLWGAGTLVATGQLMGTFISTKYLLFKPTKAAKWIDKMISVVLIITIIKMILD